MKKKILLHPPTLGLKEKRYLIKTVSDNWISTAGPNILSFENNNSIKHDKFIEVKSYSDDIPRFYWSKNEINVAKKKQNSYYLYLVDINKIHDSSYNPIIIKNPSISILENDKWAKTVENYLVERLD